MEALISNILEGRPVREVIAEASVRPQDIDVASVRPEKKDWDRANGLRFHGTKFNGDNSPFAIKARTMANAIKDPYKMIRRAKAVRGVYGTDYDGTSSSDVYAQFRRAMLNMGFTPDQVAIVDDYQDER